MSNLNVLNILSWRKERDNNNKKRTDLSDAVWQFRKERMKLITWHTHDLTHCGPGQQQVAAAATETIIKTLGIILICITDAYVPAESNGSDTNNTIGEYQVHDCTAQNRLTLQLWEKFHKHTVADKWCNFNRDGLTQKVTWMSWDMGCQAETFLPEWEQKVVAGDKYSVAKHQKHQPLILSFIAFI